MRTDITQTLKSAISNSGDWPFSKFYLILDVLKDNGFEVSFWEGEENWATIMQEKEIVGYVWKKYALLTVEKRVSDIVKIVLHPIQNIYYIEAESLIDDLFEIKDDALHRYFEGFFDFSSFTIENLWFNTNSI